MKTTPLQDNKLLFTFNVNVKFVFIDYCPNCSHSHDPLHKPG